MPSGLFDNLNLNRGTAAAGSLFAPRQPARPEKPLFAPDKSNTARAGEDVRFVTLADGRVIPITDAVDGRTDKLVRKPGSNLLYDPSDNTPYQIDPRSPKGLRNAFDFAPAVPDGAGRLVKKVGDQTLDAGEDAKFLEKQQAAAAKKSAAEQKAAATAAAKSEAAEKKAAEADLKERQTAERVRIGQAKSQIEETDKERRLATQSARRKVAMMDEELRGDRRRLSTLEDELEAASGDPEKSAALEAKKAEITALLPAKQERRATLQLNAHKAALREEAWQRRSIRQKAALERAKLDVDTWKVSTLANTGRHESQESDTGINAPVEDASQPPVTAAPAGESAAEPPQLNEGNAWDLAALNASIAAESEAYLKAYEDWKNRVDVQSERADALGKSASGAALQQSLVGALNNAALYKDISAGMSLETALGVMQRHLPKVDGQTLKGSELHQDGLRIGVVKYDERGVPELRIDHGRAGVNYSPSLRTGRPYDGAPEYAAPSRAFLDEINRGSTTGFGAGVIDSPARAEEAERRWKEQRWGAEQVAGLIDEWAASNDAERAEIIRRVQPEQAILDPDAPRLNTRKLFQEGRISLQEARLLEREFYGIQPGLNNMRLGWKAYSEGNTAAARELQHHLGSHLSSTRQKVHAFQGAVDEFMREYYQANGHRADFDATEYNQFREGLMTEETAAQIVAWLDHAGQNALGSSGGIIAGLAEGGLALETLGQYGMTREQWDLIEQGTRHTNRAILDNLWDRKLFDPSTWWRGEQGGRLHTAVETLFGKLDTEDLTESEFEDLAREILGASTARRGLAQFDERQTTEKGRELALEDLHERYDPANPRSPLAALLLSYQATRDPALKQQFVSLLLNTDAELEHQQRLADWSSDGGRISEDEFSGPMRLGFHGGRAAPLQETAVEIISNVFSAGIGKVLTAGAKAANTVRKTGQAMNAWQRAASKVDDFAEWFKKAGTVEGAATRNFLVQGSKQVGAASLGESLEEGVMSWGEQGMTLGDMGMDMLQGAVGGPAIAPAHAVIGGAVNYAAEMQAKRKDDKAVKTWVENWNEKNPGNPLTEQDFRQARSYFDRNNDQAKAVRDISQQLDENAQQLRQALLAAKRRGLTLEDARKQPDIKVLSDERASLKERGAEAFALQSITMQRALQAMQEVNGIQDAALRDFADAAMRAAAGERLNEQQEKALLGSEDESGRPLAQRVEGGWTLTQAGLDALGAAAPWLRQHFLPLEQSANPLGGAAPAPSAGAAAAQNESAAQSTATTPPQKPPASTPQQPTPAPPGAPSQSPLASPESSPSAQGATPAAAAQTTAVAPEATPDLENLPSGAVVRSNTFRGEGDITITGPARRNVHGDVEYPAYFSGTKRGGSIQARHISSLAAQPAVDNTASTAQPTADEQQRTAVQTPQQGASSSGEGGQGTAAKPDAGAGSGVEVNHDRSAGPAGREQGNAAPAAASDRDRQLARLKEFLTRPTEEIIAALRGLKTYQERLQWLADNGILKPVVYADGKSRLMVDYADRKMLLLNIGGLAIPFYQSTGKAGKKNVQSMRWYAVFGIGPDGWINKGSEEQINDQYGRDVLKKLARIMDEGVGAIPLDDAPFGYLPPDQEYLDAFNGAMNVPGAAPGAYRAGHEAFVNNARRVLMAIDAEILDAQNLSRQPPFGTQAAPVSSEVTEPAAGQPAGGGVEAPPVGTPVEPVGGGQSAETPPTDNRQQPTESPPAGPQQTFMVPVTIAFPNGQTRQMQLEVQAASPEEAAQKATQTPAMQAYQRRGAQVSAAAPGGGQKAVDSGQSAETPSTDNRQQSPAPPPADPLPDDQMPAADPAQAIAEAVERKDAAQQRAARPFKKILEAIATMFGYKIVDTGIPSGFVDRWGTAHNFGTQLIDKMQPGSEIGQWIDKVGNAGPGVTEFIREQMTQPYFHRVWFGHDPAANIGTIVDQFGWAALPEYALQLAKDSLTKSGIPLPGTQWLVHGGVVGDRTATNWLSMNVGEALSGGLAILGTFRLAKQLRNGQEVSGWAIAGVGFKLVGGVIQSNPVLIISGLTDAAMLVAARPAAVKAALDQAARVQGEPEAAQSAPPPVDSGQSAGGSKGPAKPNKPRPRKKAPKAADPPPTAHRQPPTEPLPAYSALPPAAVAAALAGVPASKRRRGEAVLEQLNAALEDYGGLFPGGVAFSESHPRMWVDANDALTINLPDMVRSYTGAAPNVMQALLRHEVIHVAVGRVMTPKEAVTLWRSLPDKLQQMVYAAYHADEILNKEMPRRHRGQWTEAESYQLAHEFLRALIEDAEFQGQVTEAIQANPTLGAQILQFLRTFVLRLRALIAGLPPGQRGAVMEYERRARNALREMMGWAPIPDPSRVRNTGQRIQALRDWSAQQPADASYWAAVTDGGRILTLPGRAATTPWDARRQLAAQARRQHEWLAWDAGVVSRNVVDTDPGQRATWAAEEAARYPWLKDLRYAPPESLDLMRQLDEEWEERDFGWDNPRPTPAQLERRRHLAAARQTAGLPTDRQLTTLASAPGAVLMPMPTEADLRAAEQAGDQEAVQAMTQRLAVPEQMEMRWDPIERRRSLSGKRGKIVADLAAVDRKEAAGDLTPGQAAKQRARLEKLLGVIEQRLLAERGTRGAEPVDSGQKAEGSKAPPPAPEEVTPEVSSTPQESAPSSENTGITATPESDTAAPPPAAPRSRKPKAKPKTPPPTVWAPREAPASGAAPALELQPPAAAAPKAPAKPKKPRQPKKPKMRDLLTAYFVPGRIVRGYGGFDRVLSLNLDDDVSWNVTVQRVVLPPGHPPATPLTPESELQSLPWQPEPDSRPRNHSTLPTMKALQAAWQNRPDQPAAPAAKSEPAAAQETPAEAVEEVKDHLEAVATYQGQRPAAEVKKELLQRIDEARAALGSRPEVAWGEPGTKSNGKRTLHFRVNDQVHTLKEFRGGWEVYRGLEGVPGSEKIGTLDNLPLNEAKKAAESSVAAAALPRDKRTITIHIPGDGTFTVARTHAALEMIRARVAKLDTKPATGKGAVKAPASRPVIAAVQKWALEWGTPESAKQAAQDLAWFDEGYPDEESFEKAARHAVPPYQTGSKLAGAIAAWRTSISADRTTPTRAELRDWLGTRARQAAQVAGVEWTPEEAQETAEADSQPVSPEAKSEPARPPRPAAPGPIQDFGEKIGGARKDVWGKLRQKLEAILPGDREITLSKHWPEPDYAALLAAGADPAALAAFKALRDIIPPKPRAGYKLQQWARLVRSLHAQMQALMAAGGQLTEAQQAALANSSLEVAAQIQFYQALGFPLVQHAKGWSVTHGQYTVFSGKKLAPGEMVVTLQRDGRYVAGPDGKLLHRIVRLSAGGHELVLQAARDLAAAARPILEQQGESTAATPKEKAKATTKYGIWSDRFTKDVFVGRKGINGVVRLKTGFSSAQEAREYLNDNIDAIEAQWEGLKVHPDYRRPINAPRQGPERRAGDVTPEMFQDAFGFRGVEFGNWVENDRRQQDLNQAYDALMDLAEALGVPPRALSLDGSLGLAFGARGTGGKAAAAAHYEPDTVAINLTKQGGPGSLAHEWWHAFDNYFARLDRTGDTAARPLDSFATTLQRAPVHMRQAVMDAFRGIAKTLKTGPFAERSKELDAARSKPYYGTMVEKSARAFERYVRDQLAAKMIASDYLVNLSKDRSPALPTQEEMAAGIKAAYDGLFTVLETETTDTGLKLFAPRPAGGTIAQRLKEWAQIDTDPQIRETPFINPDTGEGESFGDVVNDMDMLHDDGAALEYLEWLRAAVATNPQIRDIVDDMLWAARLPRLHAPRPAGSTPVDRAAQEAATSPANTKPDPTPAQQEAGNYAKGHVRIGGLDISIENPGGSTRRGTSANGKPWETHMTAHYGYVRGTEGPDGDHVDVFIAPGTRPDFRGTVYVVEQTTPDGRRFDEHKAVFGQGIDSREAAAALYRAHYEPGWQGGHSIQAMPWEVFKSWAQSPRAAAPLDGRRVPLGAPRPTGGAQALEMRLRAAVGGIEGSVELVNALEAIAKEENGTKFGAPVKSTDLEAIVREYAHRVGIKIISVGRAKQVTPGFKETFSIVTTSGTSYVDVQGDGSISVNTIDTNESGQRASGGDLVYQSALTWAKNTDRPFAPDWRDVSFVARMRRLGHLLASIVRHRSLGKTVPIFGHIKDNPPLSFESEVPYGAGESSIDPITYITRLAGYSMAWVKSVVPEIKDWIFDPKSGRLYHARNTTETGRDSGDQALRRGDLHGDGRDGVDEHTAADARADEDAFESLSELANARDRGIGPITLRRAIIVQSLLGEAEIGTLDGALHGFEEAGDGTLPGQRQIHGDVSRPSAVPDTGGRIGALGKPILHAPSPAAARPLSGYAAASAEADAQQARATATQRSTPLTTALRQRERLARDAREMWANFVSGNIDRIEHYAPGFRNIWLDTERQMALARAAVNGLFQNLHERAKKGFGYPAWWRSPGVWRRWKRFQAELLPVAARLEAAGVDAKGNFIWQPFDMRAGQVPAEIVEKQKLNVGDPITLGGERLTVGPAFSRRESTATTGRGKLKNYHLLLRPVSAAEQEQTYRDFVDQWAAFPVAKDLLDEFIMPEMDKARFEGPRGFRTAEFNRYALRDFFNEWPQELRDAFGALPELEYNGGYVPEVPIKSAAPGLAGVISELIRTYSSPARRAQVRGLREAGDVKDLFSGFQTQLMQAHLEKVRMERRGRLLKAAAVPMTRIPRGELDRWVPINDAFEGMYEAIVLARNLDPARYPALTGALNPAQRDLMRSLAGEAWQLRGQNLHIPSTVYNEMLADVASLATENLFLKLLQWWVQQFNAASLASLQYLGMNFAGNEIMKLAYMAEQGMRALVLTVAGRGQTAAQKRRLAWNTLRYMLKGMVLDRFPLRQEHLRQLVPREIYDQNHFYNALDGLDLGVLDNLKRLQFGSALLAAARSSNWDIGAKVQLAHALYQAHAREAWRDAVRDDPTMKKWDAARKRQWLRDYVAAAPASVHQEIEWAAGEWLMNYENSPRWMNSASIKPYVDPSRPQNAGRAVLTAQLQKLAIALLIPFIRWSYLFVKRIKRSAWNDGVQQLIRRGGDRRVGIASLMGLGAMLAAPATLAFLREDDDDDDEAPPAELLGRNRDVEGKDLESTLRTTNRFNASAAARIAYTQIGFLEDWFGQKEFTLSDEAGNEQDLWLRYRNYPYIKEGIVLGLWLSTLDQDPAASTDPRIQRQRTAAAGRASVNDAFGQSIGALFGEYVALGLGYSVVENIMSNASGGQGSARAADELRGSAIDFLFSPVVPHRLLRDLNIIADPTDRRTMPSKALSYQPGWKEAFKSRVPGLRSTLPMEGQVAPPAILSSKTSVPPAEQRALMEHFDIPATALQYTKGPPARDIFADLRKLRALGGGPQDVGLGMSKASKPTISYPRPDLVRRRSPVTEAVRANTPFNLLPVNRDAYRAAIRGQKAD